ncbi:outer dense fiber protein 3-like protein 2a [Paramormyrops kingsleyae]|uniref:outer dense fiber protein 3-like protein 2a n=1 Tax=Paramormyrops kingsleyae TaxID=1676925 RepID=UPI003B970691
MSETQKRRPIIAGREKGPGPARYALPTTVGLIGHDFTKPSSPAYSFHSRMSNSMYFIDSSPGPQYQVDAKTTRFGRESAPAFTILGRRRASAGTLQTPGPGTYSPERAPPVNNHRRPPSYTMGSRTRYRSIDSVPAPNQYTLPALMGSQVLEKPSSARYSVAGRCRSGGASEDFARTPGPGRYNSTDPSVYLPRQPAYSMLGRHSSPGNTAQRPGPGTYSPERVLAHKPRPPSYSLGMRHSEFVTPLVVGMLD